MMALEQNETWDLISLPLGKQLVGCRWVYNINLNLDESLVRLKAQLGAEGYSQVYDVDYLYTFSLVTKIASDQILISLAAIHHWPLH